MAQGVTSSITSDVSFTSKYQLTQYDDTLIIQGATVTLLEPQGEIFTNEGNDTVQIEDALIITDEPNLAFYLGSGNDHLSLKNCTLTVDVLTGSGDDIVVIDGTLQTKVTLNKKLTFGAGDDVLELISMLENAGSIDFGSSGTGTLRFNGGMLLPVQITGTTNYGTITNFTNLDVTLSGGTTGASLTLSGEQTAITLNGNLFGTAKTMDVTISGGTTTLTVGSNARTNLGLKLSDLRLVHAEGSILEFSDHSGYAVIADGSTVDLHDIVVKGGMGLTGTDTVWTVSNSDFSNSTKGITLTGGSADFRNVGLTNFSQTAFLLSSATQLTGQKLSFISNRRGGALRLEETDLDITDFRANSNMVSSYSALGGGGALYLNSGTMTLTSAAFSGNIAAVFREGSAFGGAIYHNGGDMTLTSAAFSGNIASVFSEGLAFGGAIYHNGGDMTLTSAAFSGNIASVSRAESAFGGAIYHNGGDMTLTSATFSGNSAAGLDGYGGAIYHNGGDMTLTSATFSGNNAGYGNGGAICHNGGDMTLTNVTFSENSAIYGGGAICHNGGNMTLTDVTFSENSAYGGGAIYQSGGIMTLTRVEFTGNIASCSSASVYGGAVYMTSGLLNMEDTLFSGNIASGPSAYGGAICLNNTTLNYVVTSGTKLSNTGNQAQKSGGWLYAGNQSTVNITVENGGILTIGDTTGEDSIELTSDSRISKQGSGYLLVNGAISGTTGLWTVAEGTLELARIARTLNLDKWTIGTDATLILSVRNDTINMGMNKRVGTIDMGGGADTIHTSGYDLTDGTVLLSDLTIDGGGRISVNLRNRSATEGSKLTLNTVYLDSVFTGNEYTDTILVNGESTLNGAIDLGGGDNVVSATRKTSFGDVLTMGGGNDILKFTDVTFGGNVELGGGTNSLTASGSAGFAGTLHGGAGKDTLSFGSATFTDAVDLGNGNNCLNVTSSATFSKTLNTGSGDDTLSFGNATFTDAVDLGGGTNGLNVTSTASFAKTLNAGSGDDTLTFGDATFAGAVSLGDGNDILTVGGTASIGDATFEGSVDLGGGDDSLTVSGTAAFKAALAAGAGDDMLSFGDATFDDVVSLGDGNDILTIGGTASFVKALDTGAGNDSLTFVDITALDVLDLGDGNNTVTVNGSGDFQSVAGGSGNDSITLKKNSTIAGEIDLGGGVNAVYIREALTADKVRIMKGGETTVYVYLNSTLTGNALSVYADETAARDTVTLNWSAQTDLDKVRILVSSDSTFDTYEFSVELYNQSKSFTLDLQQGYFIQFQAQDEDGWKQRLLDDTVAPDQVTGVNFNGKSLTWDATHDNLGGNGVKEYHVEISEDASFANPIISETVTGTEYTPASLPETALYFRVNAEDYTNNIGAWSETISGTYDVTPPSRPSGGKSTVNGYSATLSWSAASDDGTGVARYEYRVAADSDYGQIVTDGTTEACTFSVEGLNYGTYYWQVRAVDAAGNAGNWSLSKSFTTVDLVAPGMPTNLDYGIEDETSLIVIWDPAADDVPLGSGLKGYEIQLATDSAFGNIVKTVSVTDTEAMIEHLPNATYYMHVCSVDNAGNKSAWTDTVNFTIDSGPGPEPEPGKTLFFTGDFNGDGADMLAVQEDSSVTVYMNGEPWGLGVTLDDGWTIAGVGDFGGDGFDDFLRVHASGLVMGDMSSGNGLFSPQVLNFKDTGWDVLGFGDFNGNGADDVLIANPTAASETVGLLGYWESGATWTLINGYSAEWECVATGDYNGDGKCDMLWRNSFEGEGGLTYNAYCTWIVDDPVDWRMVSVANPDEWNFLCSGDFDGNGSHDIAMINDVGVVGIWGVNDGYLNSWSILSAVTPEWQLAGVADFNGDGTDDIAWANTDTGLVGAWQIENKELAGWQTIANLG